ncbi:CRTAC1 family protein [Candidatus Leptofilum sp.]|uniref:CRTAC1 family protein n=1 Tax=Candidatus Leptofilum sp. TaxID=3241576 RepID=UPI003B5B55FC
MMWQVGCGDTAVSSQLIPINSTMTPLPADTQCSNQFVPHQLPHTTTIASETVEMFDSNGAGLAINDLDNDGDMDVVLANLGGPNSILWNNGRFQFQAQSLNVGNSRAVSVVDLQGDGWADIAVTTRTGSIIVWPNNNGTFTDYIPLPGVDAPAYTMSWGDLDADGDLDLVTGSYDAGLEKDFGDSFLFGDGGGVFVYHNEDGSFSETKLADAAQALALLLVDLNDDGRLDILVGNDFAVQDMVWLQTEAGWEADIPFNATTHSTMSFDAADINNDGRQELLATDMKPYQSTSEVMAQWQPMMDMMMHGEIEDDPQVMENVVQVADADGRFQNQAKQLGVSATGWSWSAKFGDLDQDGFQDLYVVNGMAAAELFSHLPNNELIEENQVFRSNNGQTFDPMPGWGLNSQNGGRSMNMADMDNDGDLDIVVNNLLSPAQIFENQLCGGHSLVVNFTWRGSQNQDAIGAVALLETSNGRYLRELRSNSGYLSGDPAQLHFGFPQDTELHSLEIVWPDGEKSILNNLTAQTIVTVERP